MSRPWQTDAACLGADDPDGWIDRPLGATRFAPHAHTTCERCPVQTACLTTHIDEEYGLFGNTTPEQREAIRTRRTHQGVAA